MSGIPFLLNVERGDDGRLYEARKELDVWRNRGTMVGGLIYLYRVDMTEHICSFAVMPC